MSPTNTNPATCPCPSSMLIAPDPLSQNPNRHPSGESPPELVPSHPLWFLPPPAHNPNADPPVTCPFIPMSLDDMNPATSSSSTSLNLDPTLHIPPQLMPSHPLPFVSTRLANPIPLCHPTFAPSRVVNPRSSQLFLQPSPPSLSRINLAQAMHNEVLNLPSSSRTFSLSNSYKIVIQETFSCLPYVASQVAKAEPPKVFLQSASHRPRKPSRAENESLLPNNLTIRSRQSQAVSLAAGPVDRPPFLKKQRISRDSETPRQGNHDTDAPQISHPGLQGHNPHARIAQQAPKPGSTSGNQMGNNRLFFLPNCSPKKCSLFSPCSIELDDNYAGNITKSLPPTFHRAKISNPTADDLFSVAKALGGNRLLDLVCTAYASYVSLKDKEEDCQVPSEQSATSKYHQN